MEFNLNKYIKKTVESDSTDKLLYCIQKHSATRLHYDFRLQIDNVLKSWAMPVGPYTDPIERPIAIQVSNHPLSWAYFEGTIPKGNYAAGTVMVWDIGTFEYLDQIPLPQAFKDGKIEFFIHGKKLKGKYS